MSIWATWAVVIGVTAFWYVVIRFARRGRPAPTRYSLVPPLVLIAVGLSGVLGLSGRPQAAWRFWQDVVFLIMGITMLLLDWWRRQTT
jgi:hypothetical protein